MSAYSMSRCHSSIARGAQQGERATVWQHAQRALELIEQARHRRHGAGRLRPWRLERLAAAGRSAPARSHVQCLDRDAAFQTLTTLARALRADRPRSGRAASRGLRRRKCCSDFQRLLLVDGVLAGYAVFEASGGAVRYLLHPRDRTTGVRYSALAMIHAILEDMLTPAAGAQPFAS